LVVVAKTKAASVYLAQQFEFRKARKTYMAIVNGNPQPNSHENEVPSSEWNTIDYDLDGKSAITKWRIIRKAKSLHGKDGQVTLVELKPKTGRYHQLRRHMAWICNTPLVGDSTYDAADDSALRLRKRGLFLCANEIELEHPYYNTLAGQMEWTTMGRRERYHGDDAIVWEDNDSGKVMVKARIALPDKFDSFLQRENERAIKFRDG
jgi:23S rRNA-/tRNA-specific pseudouridylate synthase